MMGQEPGQSRSGEGWTPQRSRTGLEVPIQGRLIRERILFFGPPAWHDALVALCLAGGLFMSVSALLGHAFLHFWFGPAVMLAGLWGLLSTERLAVNLQKGTYHLQVHPRWKVQTGSTAEWDALNVVAERRDLPGLGSSSSASVVFHLVLHYKGGRRAPMVINRLSAPVPHGYPLESAAQPLIAQASAYGRLMGLPVYLSLGGFSPNPRPLV